MNDEIMAEEATEAVTEAPLETQEERTFTQEELDRIVADRVARTKRQYDKRLDGIDLDEARQLIQERQNAEIENQKKRGEFEKVLKEQHEQHRIEKEQLKAKLEFTLVDKALLEAAGRKGAVQPDQVSSLLRGSVRLSDDGNTAEVYDSGGTPRYNEAGDLLTVDDLVNEFLSANPHFVKASPGGAGSQGAVGGSTVKPMSPVDMLANYDSGGREAYRALQLGKK